MIVVLLAATLSPSVEAQYRVTARIDRSSFMNDYAQVYSGTGVVWEDGQTIPLLHSWSGMNNLAELIGSVGSHIALWSQGTIQDLHALRQLPYPFTGGIDINDSGEVLGVSGLTTWFVLRPDGGLVEAPSTSSSTLPFFRPCYLNNHGVVAGLLYVDERGGFIRSHIATWNSRTGSFTDLGGFADDRLTVTGINDQGQIVGYGVTISRAIHAFLFDGSTTVDLGQGRALALNNHAQVLIQTGIAPLILWLPQPSYGLAAGRNDLRRRTIGLPSGTRLENPRDINDAGQILAGPHPGVRMYLLSPVNFTPSKPLRSIFGSASNRMYPKSRPTPFRMWWASDGLSRRASLNSRSGSSCSAGRAVGV